MWLGLLVNAFRCLRNPPNKSKVIGSSPITYSKVPTERKVCLLRNQRKKSPRLSLVYQTISSSTTKRETSAQQIYLMPEASDVAAKSLVDCAARLLSTDRQDIDDPEKVNLVRRLILRSHSVA